MVPMTPVTCIPSWESEALQSLVIKLELEMPASRNAAPVGHRQTAGPTSGRSCCSTATRALLINSVPSATKASCTLECVDHR